MARQLSAKRPKDLRFTVSELLGYMGRHRFLLFTVAALVTVSACANLLGTYMIRPVVNSLAGADVSALVRGVAATAIIYGAGVLSAFGYTQTMVKAAQKILFDMETSASQSVFDSTTYILGMFSVVVACVLGFLIGTTALIFPGFAPFFTELLYLMLAAIGFFLTTMMNRRTT